jgi:hypothetical protein
MPPGIHQDEPERPRPAAGADQEERALLELKTKLSSQRWRLNHLYNIVDATGREILFVMNYAQTLLYLGMWFCNIILKSRQHGITTFICLLYLDICLFNSNMHACIIAHNKDDAEDFFQKKILFAYNRLPDLLKLQLRATRESRHELVFANGSSIRVTTSGRSGTYQMVHISELGKMCAKYPMKAEEVVSGTLNAIHSGMMVSVESTAEGQDGKFYEMVTRAMKAQQEKREIGKLEFKFFFFGWQDNELNRTQPTGVEIYPRISEYLDKLQSDMNIRLSPEQRAWYAQKEMTQGDLMFREHPSTPEEAFKGSLEGAYYGKEFTALRNRGQITSVPHRESMLVRTWWDLGFNDLNAIWFTQDVGREIHAIHYYENSGESLVHYRSYLDKMSKERGYRYGQHMAPHDIMVHEYTSGVTRWDSAAQLGIKFEIGNRTSEQLQIERVRGILPIVWFDREECDAGIRALESYRKEWNPKLGAYRDKPFHDWASHGASAFAQIGVMHPFSSPITFGQSGAFDVKPDGARSSIPDSRGWT